MTVRDLMTPSVETLPPEATVLDARDRLRDGGFHHVAVVRDDRLLGIVSDRDVLRAAGPSLGLLTWEDDAGPGLDTPLTEIMTHEPITADPTMSVAEAADAFLRYDISALPVLDEGRLVGIVTTADVLRLAATGEGVAP
ncbi:MAG TPA: CBS domain-containing protein [Bacteroidetes bacterium]|nr:CBS domain-containing protein [Bacteroidota bacterium]